VRTRTVHENIAGTAVSRGQHHGHIDVDHLREGGIDATAMLILP
jgi:hypothetical protein